MNILAATLVVLLAVSVSSLRQYPRRYADNYERYKNSDAVLEPPRPEEFEFYKSASEPKSTRDEKKESFDSEDEFGSFFKRPSEAKRPSGKSQYHSEAKSIPAPKPIFDATEQVEHKEEKNTDPEEKIRCVKVDTKPVSADDVYRGRFRRAAVDKTMTCYKCEDLQKGGFYQKCSYGTDPGNKAFFVSHEKTSSSNEKPKHFKFDWDDVAQDGDREESKIEKEIRDSFFEPSSEYLAASSSVGKFAYDGPDFSSSNTNYRYEVPESSYEKARIPVNHPKSDYYQPSPSYLKALRQVPDGDKKAKKEEGEEKQPSEHRYSSYGEKESSKGKKASSEEEGSDEDGYSGHPSEQHNSKKEVASEEGDDDEEEEEAEGSDEYAGKPTEYHFKSFKKQPSKSYSYHTTDPPVDLYYETKEASPSQQKKDYASSPNDYVYSSKKKQPTKLYSYESTDKPVVFAYKKETKTEPKSVHKPAYEFYSPTEFSFSKTVDDPLKTYYESSSYGGEDDKPAEGNAPKPQAVEAPKSKKEQQRRKNNAPQVREYSTTEEELPDTFVAQPSEELKKAMGDFLGKDRTNCTQVQRKQMTCWQCIDDSGTKQEECMYVASSQPAAHQTAYSDRKENKLQPKQAAAEPKKEEQSVDQKQVRSSGAEQRRRRRPSSGQRVSGTSVKETRVRRRRPDAVTSSTTEVVTVQAEGPPKTERRPRQKKPEQEGKKANQEGRRRRPKKEEPTKAEAAELKERRVRKPAEEKKQDKKETTPAPE